MIAKPRMPGARPAKRRRLRLAVVAGALPALLALAACTGEPARHTGPTAGTAAPAGRPNIVFVLTDDLSWNLVPYLPHLQAMQQGGTTFTNYDVVDSLCCPSRTSIFTGAYPHNTGVFTNGGKDGGYQTFTARGKRRTPSRSRCRAPAT